MGDFQQFQFRFVNIGLNLRDSPDKVEEGKWARLTNLTSSQEGQVQARPGLTFQFATGVDAIHSIRRGGTATLLVGAGGSLYRNNTVFPTGGYSGNPLGINPYRPTLTSEVWNYISDSNQMRKVNADGTDYKWGVTAPVTAASFSAVGVGVLDSSVAGGVAYDWRYTYYSSRTGAQSNGSPEVVGIAVVNQQGQVSVNASTDPQVDEIWLYRRGGTLDTWRFSTSGPNVSGTMTDNNADSSIAANEALSEDRLVPFTSVDSNGNTVYEVPLAFVWGPFLGKYWFACGDPYRPGFAYWTNAQAPDEAAEANNVEVTGPGEPLQNGVIYQSTPWVFSKDNLYILDFGGSSDLTITPRKAPCGRGLAAPWAVCVGDRIYFLASDGIYATDGTPSIPISEDLRPIFQGINISGYNAVNMTDTTGLRLEWRNNFEVWFHYTDTGGARQALRYNVKYSRWENMTSALTNIRVGYADENSSQAVFYLGGQNGNVYTFDQAAFRDAGTAISCNGRTGAVDFGLPTTLKEFGNIILDINTNGVDVVLTPYINTEQTALGSHTVNTGSRQKVPLSLGGAFGYNLSVDLTWAQGVEAQGPIVYQMGVQYRPDEESIKYWDFKETTHGLPGWQHVRDGYLVVRSGASLVLTITVDGTAYTPTFITNSNTGGEKRKVYWEMPATKGKVFKYTLTSSAEFRLYGNECEVRVKPWLTNLGYQLVSPFSPQVP